jgi:hypothetical protein
LGLSPPSPSRRTTSMPHSMALTSQRPASPADKLLVNLPPHGAPHLHCRLTATACAACGRTCCRSSPAHLHARRHRLPVPMQARGRQLQHFSSDWECGDQLLPKFYVRSYLLSCTRACISPHAPYPQLQCTILPSTGLQCTIQPSTGLQCSEYFPNSILG